MTSENNIDFGSIQIHKEALEDICAAAIAQVEGVTLIENNIQDKFLGFVGRRHLSGISINIDNNGQVNIRLKISVRFGLNIPTVSSQIQNTIREVVSKTADIDLRDIDINVLRIERGS